MTPPEQILIYDGECGFCTSCVAWIQSRWNPGVAPRAIAWQRLSIDAPLLVTPDVEELARSVWWIDGDGQSSGSRALARALLAASRPWPLVGRLLLTPPVSWLAPPLYRLIARYRHHLPGATPACRLDDHPLA
jgi:predicted DCC family thiol-disulfide oxidoreductase YuxK